MQIKHPHNPSSNKDRPFHPLTNSHGISPVDLFISFNIQVQPCRPYCQCMYAFTYWHAYYDSAYLHYPLKISPFFYQELQITSAPHLRWTIPASLPQLPKLYEILEKFMSDQGLWVSCKLQQAEAKAVQTKLNDILLQIYCEKYYAKEYWTQDKRRIQASFVHFFIILKHLILALIPTGCSCIMEAARDDKLCIELKHLQNLINEVLGYLKSIHKFMFDPIFKEENNLTKLFFQQIGNFSKQLPLITTQELREIPKLMHYICLRNPIDTTKDHSFHLVDQIRKKSETLQLQIKVMSPLRRQEDEDDRNSDILDNKEFIKGRDNHKSVEKTNSITSKSIQKYAAKHLHFFKFAKPIWRTEPTILKKPTLDSIETKEKSLSIDKMSRYRSSTIDPNPVLLKTKTFVGTRSKLISTVQDPRTRMKTTKSRESKKNIELKLKFSEAKDEEELERKQRALRKKAGIPIPKHVRYSQQLNLTVGKSKGWAILREYLANKIAQRKMRKLLSC